MIRNYRKRKLVLAFGDLVLLALIINAIVLWRFGGNYVMLRNHMGAAVITIAAYMIALYIFDLYNVSNDIRSNNLLLKLIVTAIFAGIISTFFYFAFPYWKYDRSIWFIQVVAASSFLLFWRRLFFFCLPKKMQLENVFILGAGKAGDFFVEWMTGLEIHYKIKGFIDDDESKTGQYIRSYKVLGKMSELIEIGRREGVRTLLIAITNNKTEACINKIFHAQINGWSVRDMENIYEETMQRVPIRHIQGECLLFAKGFFLKNNLYTQRCKEFFDYCASIFLFVLFSPLILLIMLAIKLDSEGPIFYKQNRIGQDNTVFTLFKFRSMVNNAESNGVTWAQINDSRMTRVGKWLRRLRLDEIPQLYNVLRGEMSLIGPRPERPELISDLEIRIPYYSSRHMVKPGLTGWAQVNYRYGASIDDAMTKLEYDLYYIKNMSFLLDCQILLKTIGIVLFGQGR